MDTIHVTRAGQGEHILFGADIVSIKARGNATAGTLLAFEIRVPAGGGPPALHRHAYSEVFYLLDGEFEISTVDADNRLQTAILKAGDTVAIPSMAWHTFKNVGAGAGAFLAIHSSPVMEELIDALGVPFEDLHNPPTPAGPPSPEERERFARLIGQYMEMLPPGAVVR
jgi:mannose-6-phosphate isomerase-like protein (cupin superfamily)